MWRSTQQTKKVVQYVSKVGKKCYAREKILPFVLNPPLLIIGCSKCSFRVGTIRRVVLRDGPTTDLVTRLYWIFAVQINGLGVVELSTKIGLCGTVGVMRFVTSHLAVLPHPIFCTYRYFILHRIVTAVTNLKQQQPTHAFCMHVVNRWHWSTPKLVVHKHLLQCHTSTILTMLQDDSAIKHNNRSHLMLMKLIKR